MAGRKRKQSFLDGGPALDSAEDFVEDAAPGGNNNNNNNDSSVDFDVFAHRWLDLGTEVSSSEDDTGSGSSSSDNNNKKRIEHLAAEVIVGGKRFRLEKGSNVLLWNDSGSVGDDEEDEDEDEEDDGFVDRERWQSDWCARIESMWEEPSPEDESVYVNKFRARWFYKKSDIELLSPDAFTGPISRDDLLYALTPKDIVLTNETDDNYLETIGGLIQVFSRRPEDIIPSDMTLSETSYLCRYGISVNTQEPRRLLVLPYEGINDDWRITPTSTSQTTTTELLYDNEDQQHHPTDENDNMMEDDDNVPPQDTKDQQPAMVGGTITSDDENDNHNDNNASDDGTVSSANDGYQNSDVNETEGSTTKSDIRLGPLHQVDVPPYDPSANTPMPLDRTPTMVWKPNAVDNKAVDEYLSRASAILTPYAEQNNLTMEEPFMAIPADDLEKMIHKQTNGSKKAPIFISSVSTGSTLSSGEQNNALIRECNMDLLLELFHKNNYDIKAALDTIEANPGEYLEAWTNTEKELFDAGFRRYSGSLRMIGKTVGPSKHFKEVVDFHYRVKIPDQFRKFQEKKREQAVRIMECIEARKFQDSVVHGHIEQNRFGGGGGGGGDHGDSAKRGRLSYNWTETSTKEVIGVVEEKRLAAKDLLLDIERIMGRDKMSEVASAIMTLHQEPENDIRIDFEEMLKDKPDLLQRLNHFLPAKLKN